LHRKSHTPYKRQNNMSDYSFIANAHPAFIEALYQKYRENPAEIDKSWVDFFKGFDYGGTTDGEAIANAATGIVAPAAPAAPNSISLKEFGVSSLIFAYRNRGHLQSDTNPIRKRKDRKAFLKIQDHNLTDADMDTVFHSGEELGLKNATLRQIIDHLENIYCKHIGFEYAHIENREQRTWLREKIEKRNLNGDFGLNLSKKRRILEKINDAVGFEDFLAKKYVAQKRFGLEGGDATIAGLDAIINIGVENGVQEVIIGMAHRGRLNILANTLGKTYEQIFTEFEGAVLPTQSFGSGDVKYHMGFSSQVTTTSGQSVYLKLLPNPSHLEAVNPVVEGFARAKADLLYKSEYDSILPILIHGDAAVAGQGIVFETLQMSRLEGYITGGSVHFVINNQVGFTTDFDDARSSTYSTGVAAVTQSPVFHVNGDDPEAVVFTCELATEFRQKFNEDVFIDMVCYRRNGHNEADDYQYTQPELFNIISKHPNVRELYTNTLVARGDVDKALAEDMQEKYREVLQARLDEVKQHKLPYTFQAPEKMWQSFTQTFDVNDLQKSPPTGISKETINKVMQHLFGWPADFTPIGKVNRLIDGYKKRYEEGKFDWAMGELLSFGSILLEGKDVRMSGEDVKRGTFSHRHAVFIDANNSQQYNRLSGMSDKQGKFRIYNSLLSEYAVLGFEYGYSLATPDSLVIWEAQFGDFSNGAQTIIDQFISAGESKWGRMSGLVMLLPHGYEGQGPEHSSARLERFVQMGADFNMFVTNITTPANLFHAFRRQLALPFRKPMVNMSPKSTLRHPDAVSTLADFEEGSTFKEIIDDPETTAANVKNVKRIVFCTGKVYFDLRAKKLALQNDTVALVRVEQLYPFPSAQVKAIKRKYSGSQCVWLQEEPANMGAWQYLQQYNLGWKGITRTASASPATGFKKIHDKEQEELMVKAFTL
jgi:2-oxoglutarate dehydrogenase E1 component